MPTANTFSTPTAGKSFTLSLNDFNNSLLSLFSNFYGPTPPSSLEITVAGVATAPYTGMLYRSSIYNAFYAYDATAKKGGGISSNYTRVGLGSRNFESITDLVTNIATIEQTELLTTVGAGANYRLYMKTANTPSIVDVGIPPASSLTSAMFISRQVPNTAIAVNSLTGHELATNFVYNSIFTSKGRVAIDSLAERVVTTSITGNVLNLDVGLASMHRVNVTSHINSIIFSNNNTTMGWGVSVFFYANGTGYNFNTNSNVAYPNSNTPVTLTTTAGRMDTISFVSPTGSNVGVLAFVGGQGF
jgi:hypothetical protein